MASSERIFCVLVALLGGCTLLTNADDHRDGTSSDMGLGDASVADAGDDDLGVDEDMGPPEDMSTPGEDMTTPDDMFMADMGPDGCGVGNLNGGSLSTTPTTPVYDLANFTIETWYRPAVASLSGDHNLFGRWGQFGVSGSYALFIRNGRPALGLSCEGPDFHAFVGAQDLAANTWVHLAATFDVFTRQVQVFVNGIRVGNSTATCQPANPLGTAADLVLGYDDPSGGGPARGLVDEARLSSMVRYSDDFTPVRTFETVDDQTIALYQFEDAALPAMDSTSNGGDLENRGSAAGLSVACRP